VLFKFCSKATNLAVVMLAALTRVEMLRIVNREHDFPLQALDVKHMVYCSAARMQAAYRKADTHCDTSNAEHNVAAT